MIIKPLTSLRFFFAFFVLLSHLSFLENSKSYSLVYNYIFKEGFLGVSFFFILSGFVLSLNYAKITKADIKKFYLYRLARIYPVYLLTLLLSVFIVQGSLYKFIIQIFGIQSFFPNQEIYFSYNAPSWSISDEFFFYLLFPLVISLFRKINFTSKTIITTLLCISVVIITNYIPTEKQHYYIYISPITRFVDFVIGIYLFYLCDLIKSKNYIKKNYMLFEILTLIIFITFFYFHEIINLSYRYSSYYWIPMSLIILSASSEYYIKNYRPLIINKLLSHKIFVHLGEISFCFYMIHYLVILIIEKYFNMYNNTILIFLTLTISLILSSIFYRFVEKPINKFLKKMI